MRSRAAAATVALLLWTGSFATAAEGPTLKILRHGPRGAVSGGVQVRIDFDRPVVPIGPLGDPERTSLLGHFSIEPVVTGSFRLLGTSTVVFEPDHSLPPASRFTVAVEPGFDAVDGARLEKPFSWSFTTPAVNIWITPANGAHHVLLDPEASIRANMALDIPSLRAAASLTDEAGRQLPFEIAEDESNAPGAEDLGMHRRSYTYHLRLAGSLRKDRKYRITVAPGVRPRRGNLPTAKEYRSRFRTYPPFRYSDTGFCGGCGPTLQTRPYLNFTNLPEWESFGAGADIEPPPQKWPFRRYGCDGKATAFSLDDRLLAARTTYRVTLPADLRDIYGQELENPGDVTFVTGDLTPRLRGPSGYGVISPSLPPRFVVETAGVPTIHYRITALEPRDILFREVLSAGNTTRLLMERMPLVEKEAAVPLGADGKGRRTFELGDLLGGGEYGAVAYSIRSPKVPCFDKPRRLEGVLLRTNLGLFTRFTPVGGTVKVNRLTDGAPAAGVALSLYRSDTLPRLEEVWDRITGENVTEAGAPCATGLTDEDGVWEIAAADMKACTRRTIKNKVLNELYPPGADPDDISYDQDRYGFAEPPQLTVVAARDADWTFLQTREYGVPSVWRFGVMSAWEGERPLPRGTIFSDREIYRPGETVRMKGVARYLLYGRMHNGVGSEYTIKLIDPRGREEELTKVKVSEFGTFSFDVPTQQGQGLGTWQVVAQGAHRNLRFHGAYRLAEFKAPQFAVTLATDRDVAVAGEPVAISWKGRYYFGSPMKNAPARLDIVRQETLYRPEGWRDYTFGISSWLRENRTALSGQVRSDKVHLDAEGAGTATVTVTAGELPRPMLYRAFAEVEDATGQSAGTGGAFTVLPDRRLVGVRLSRWIVTKKDEITAQVVVTDPGGEPLPGIPLKVKLLRREWHSIQRERHDGRIVTEHRPVLTEIDSRAVDSGTTPVDVSLSPPTAGSFIVRAELAEAPASGTAAAAALWAAGDDYVPWRGSGEDRLEIVFDKTEYAVGDEAVALIRSPFRKADLHITLLRDRVFAEQIIPFEGSAYTYRFTVTEEMLPNAFVGAFLVNRGGPLVPVEEEKGRHMEKIGFAPFRVEKKTKYLEVDVATDRERYRPGEKVRVDLAVTDQAVAGRRSELTVMVVDEAILALTGYRPPDLVKVVYADRGLSARVNDNRPFLMSKAELLQKGQGYGGGLEDGPRLRKRFLRLAHYEPALVTDGSGRASFSFELPDNLTTFRVMVVAVGEEDLFGYGDGTLTVSQPFLMQAAFPRYSRLGDTFLAGVAVTNRTDTDGRADITVQVLDADGPVGLSSSDSLHGEVRGLRLAAGASAPVLFPFESLAAGSGRLRFTASFTGEHGGAAVRESDAVEAVHAVRDLAPTETVVAVGETTGEVLQKLKVDDAVRRDTGGLRVDLSSSALADLGASASYLVRYPYGCLEQTVSRLLALLELRHLGGKYGFRLDAVKSVDQVIAANVRKVLAMQHWDGGFLFWPTADRSTCWISPYVADLFARMEEFGLEVPGGAVAEFKEYLHRVLRNPCTTFSSWRARAEYRIRILTGLARLGEGDQTWFEEFFNRRKDLSYGAQIALASLLGQSPGWESKAAVMLDEIMNGLFITARTAHFEEPRELPPSWTFLSSPVITTAAGLRLLLAMDPGSDLAARMARYLLEARVNGRWRNTYENSRALDALVELSSRREAVEPDFLAAVRLAGEAILEETFSGFSTESRSGSVDMSALPAGLTEVTVGKEGPGRLYYTIAYSYRRHGSSPAHNEGFTVKRTVRDWETKAEVAVFDDTPAADLRLAAGRIYEVELEFKAPQTGYHFVLDDALPAGLAPIDTSLRTTSGRYGAGTAVDDTRRGDYAHGFWNNPFNHKELRDDGVGLFADALRPGLYRFRYLARAATAGRYSWPAARASLMYEPEQFGTCAEGNVEIVPTGVSP